MNESGIQHKGGLLPPKQVMQCVSKLVAVFMARLGIGNRSVRKLKFVVIKIYTSSCLKIILIL